MTILVVDTDHITYRAAASCEPTKTKEFREDREFALARATATIDHLLMTYNPSEVEWYIGGEGNWRTAIYPEYKANRKNIPRPMWLEDVRELLVTKYKATIVNDREVDDMCGIRLTQLQEQTDEKVVCCSLDKDLKQVPGYHYSWEIHGANWSKPAAETFVSPLEGLRTFYKQVITGDGADHVPAFDGAFRTQLPKFVAKLLEPIDKMTDELEMWDYVKDVYYLKSQVDEDGFLNAQRNAQVLYVQRDWEDKWEPPGLMGV